MKTTKLTPLFSISLLYCLLACQPSPPFKSVSEENQNSRNVTWMDFDDTEMNDAIAQAKAQFSIFENYIESPHNRTFAVKIGILYPGGKEHLWITDVVKENGQLSGRVDNQPLYITEVQQHDLIEIPRDLITDWMVIENHYLLAGGYTLKLMRQRLSEEEQKIFDAETQLKWDSIP